MQDDMLTIDPDRCLIMCGTTARLMRYTPRTFTVITRSNSSGVVSRTSPTPLIPALLKSTSIRLNRFTIRWASATAWASSVTSTCSAAALPFVFRIPATVAFAARRSMSATTTAAPSFANSRALAWPMPEPAPVIRQTLPWSLPIPALGPLGADQLGEAERDQDDGSVDGVDPRRADVGQGQYVRDQRQKDHARESAYHAAPPAVERDAADHGGSEDSEDEVGALAGGHRGDSACLHQSTDRREDARDHEHTNSDSVDLDAGRARRLEVASDGVHGAADPVIAQEQGGRGERGDCDPDCDRHAE